MSGSDGADLPEMVASVDKVKTAPLVDAKRTQDDVGDGATLTEERFGLGEELVDTGEADSDFVGKFFSGERGRADGGTDRQWGFAAAWEVSESGDRILTDALLERGPSAGRSSLGQTCVDRYLGVGISKAKVLGDLLDTPLIGVRRRWAELGLGGVESFKGIGYLSVELLEDGIHGRMDYGTPGARVLAGVIEAVLELCELV